MPNICNAGFLLSFYSLILTSGTVYAPWQPLAAVQTHVWDMATASVATFYVNFCLTCSLPILKYCQQYRGESMCTTQKLCHHLSVNTTRNIKKRKVCVCAGGSATFSCVAAGGGLASKAEPVGDKQLHLLTRGEWWLLKASKDPSVAFAGQHEAKNGSQNERVVWIFWI